MENINSQWVWSWLLWGEGNNFWGPIHNSWVSTNTLKIHQNSKWSNLVWNKPPFHVGTTSGGWTFPGVWWVQGFEKHLWASDWKSGAVLCLLMKSLISERFAWAKEIRAEFGGQQRRFNFFSPWWFGVMTRNMPWVLSCLCSGGQVTVALGLCKKLIRAWEMISWKRKCSGRCCSGRAKSSQQLRTAGKLQQWKYWGRACRNPYSFSFFFPWCWVLGVHFDTGFLFGAVDSALLPFLFGLIWNNFHDFWGLRCLIIV